jgi:PD-(D/E)XK nuclease superfamily
MAQVRRNSQELLTRTLNREPPHPPKAEQVSEAETGGDSSEGDSGAEESVASPFLPGTNIQYAWDSTSLEWFKRCPRLYQYCMIEGWRPKDESVHLRFGIEFHAALHNYDKNRAAGMDHEDSLLEVVREMLICTDGWRPDHNYKNLPNLLRSVIWYLDHYDPDPAQTLIMGAGEPACEVNFKFELDWGPKASSEALQEAVTEVERGKGQVGEITTHGYPAAQPYILCGYLDRIVSFQNELFVMDRKTTRTTPGAYYFNQFEPNNQMSLYTLAGQIIFGTTIKGVIIDSVQVAIEFSRPCRGITYRTKDQTQEWVEDLRFWFARAEDFAAEGYWPMNDTSCDKYGGCAFREVCSKSPHVREMYLKSNFTQEGERWNPLKARV